MFGIKKNISKTVEYYKMIVNESLAAKYELIYIKAILKYETNISCKVMQNYLKVILGTD